MENNFIETASHLVMSKDLNSYGTLFGGKLISWMDELAVILAIRLTGKECVTARFDGIEFKKSVTVNDILNIRAKVIHIRTCYLEINIQAYKVCYGMQEEYIGQGTAKFVVLGKDKKPIAIKMKES